MDAAAKQRLAFVLAMIRRLFHIGFIPTILYLGLNKGGEDPNIPLSIFSLFF